MAYVYKKDENENQGPIMSSGAPSVLSGGSAPTTQNPEGAGGGSQFSDVTKFLEQNRGQANKLSQDLGNTLTTKAKDAQQTLGTQQSAFNQAVDSSEVKPNESLISEVKASPTSVANDAEKLQQFSSMRDAEYQGPLAFEGSSFFQPAKQQIDSAKSLLDQSKTEEGRMQLLGGLNQGKQSNRGAQTLDNLLIQGSQQGKQTIDQASQWNDSLDQRLSSVNQAATQRANEAKQNTDSVRTSVRDLLNNSESGLLPSFEKDLLGTNGQGGRVRNAQQQLIDLNSRVSNDLSDQFTLDQETLDLFGLKNDDRIFGLNLNEYYQQASPNDINIANVATTEDYDRYLALATLAGINPELLRPEDIGKAGTAISSTVKGSLPDDLKRVQEQYDNSYKNTTGGILNPSYLGTSNMSIFSTYDDVPMIGSLPGRLATATPYELDTYYLPALEQYAPTRGAPGMALLNAVKNSLADWKRSQGYFNQIKKK